MVTKSIYEVMIYHIDESNFEIFPHSISYIDFYRIKSLLLSNAVNFGVSHLNTYFGSDRSSRFVIQAHYDSDNISLYNKVINKVLLHYEIH